MDVPLHSRVTPWRALFPMLFARERYLDLAVHHAVALCSTNAQYQQSYAAGVFPSPQWIAETRSDLAAHATVVVRCFWSSLFVTCALVAVALLVALLLGRVAPDRPLDIGKFLSLLGGSLAGWATLFELGGNVATFSGKQLHEETHPVLFRVVFLLGVAIAAIGQVW